MDVRCKKCDKLFRVPDERFSGKGIKFACTRCGEYVIISNEELQQYSLSKTAAAVLDIVEPKPVQEPQKPESIKPSADEHASEPKPVEPPRIEPMQVQCGKCDKLFRVPKEKFSGKGIKFACTRCGEYVKITREEFERYLLSKTTSSVLDRSAPGPEPVQELRKPEYGGPADKGPASALDLPSFDLSFANTPDALPEEQPSPFEVGPTNVTRPAPAYIPEPGQAPRSEPKIELEFVSKVRQRVEPVAPKESTPEDILSEIPVAYSSGPEALATLSEEQPSPFDQISSMVGPTKVTEPAPAYEPVPIQTLTKQHEPDPEPRPEPEPQPEPAPKSTSMPETVRATPPAARRPEPSPSETPVRETVYPVSLKTVKKVSPAGSFSWVEKVFLLVIVVIIISFGGYGLFTYIQSPPGKDRKPASATQSIEGLQIKNVTSSRETNGDILIAGTVENASDKEKAAWYVVVEVYNAQGTVIDKLRLLNGKQLYSRRDYEILRTRGVNVQELKAKNLEEQGVVIPAKGSVTFLTRYVQPPESMASLNPILQTFDPVRLFKEIAEDSK